MNKIPLVCPCHLKKDLKKFENLYICTDKNCIHAKKEKGFAIIKSLPIIISEENTDTICSKENIHTYITRSSKKFKNFKKFLTGESKVTKKNCEKFIDILLYKNKSPKVLVIGGAEKGEGTDILWNNKKIEINSIDIYASDNVDIICDSHYLCFKNNYYDGVWIQAVLEHVVEPNVVVNEIFRVLKNDGIVYAETPFMQQVHEGAYDFNRFTVLGHRYLFKKFELIEIGGNQGADVVFAWSAKYLIWSILRNKKLANLVGLLTTLVLRILKPLVSKPSLFDSSSGVFFLGRKAKYYNLTHKNLIKLYKGMQ